MRLHAVGVTHSVYRSLQKFGCVLAVSSVALPMCVVAQAKGRALALVSAGSLAGAVYDADGVPQMGALVEALLPDFRIAASTVTDARGQYRFSLQPGSYRVRATAAFQQPAVRERQQIVSGTRSVLNLTLTALLAPGGWLPVSRRTGNEASDDWTWTLRSSASRSILRLVQQGQAGDADEKLAISSSGEANRRGVTAGRLTLKDSEGGFARGGDHSVLVLTRLNEDGSGAVLHADFSGPRSPYPVAPSAEISAGLHRRSVLNGASRVMLTYSNHPELVNSSGATGLQGFTLRSAQRIDFGDVIRVDVGSVLRGSNLGGNAFLMEPFLRAAFHPGPDVVLAYTITHARGTESLDDLDRVQALVPFSVLKNGRVRLETGTHHALSATGRLKDGTTAELVLYQDSVRTPLIAGIGKLSQADVAQDGLVADPTTHTFRVAARNFDSAGVRFAATKSVGRALSAGLEVSTGSALSTPRGTKPATMSEVLSHLSPTRSYAATSFLSGKLSSTGTTLHAAYRWQPHSTLTAVDAFHTSSDGAYLSCSIRQSLEGVRFLPRGLEALLDVQNLLAQGYQPFVSNDGQTLYLAQTPRMMQAGVSFSF